MTCSVDVYGDVAEFKADALPFLEANALHLHQLLVSCDRLTQESFAEHGYWLACLREDEQVSGVCCCTSAPPHRLLSISDWPDAALKPLKDALAGFPADGLIGPTGSVRRLAAGLGFHRLRMHMLNYVLKDKPDSMLANGYARKADLEDTPLLLDWFAEFEIECGVPPLARPELLQGLEQDLQPGSSRHCRFWVVDGEPVAMSRMAVAGSVARISAAYTRPDQRGKGYAGALIAHLAREATDLGADVVCLYADAANPSSNSLYRRIGFQLVGAFEHYE
jgi:ribosomal protein S18 acetylase RimI-like enzyme